MIASASSSTRMGGRRKRYPVRHRRRGRGNDRRDDGGRKRRSSADRRPRSPRRPRRCDRGRFTLCLRGTAGGGPLLKTTLSRLAGRSLHLLARVGTRDATNSFKAYSGAFLRDVDIDSRHGFEIGIELVAKARRLRLPVAETPTIWLDREHGVSNFNVAGWIPHYLRWYFFAFGRRLTPDQVRDRARATRKDGSA